MTTIEAAGHRLGRLPKGDDAGKSILGLLRAGRCARAKVGTERTEQWLLVRLKNDSAQPQE